MRQSDVFVVDTMRRGTDENGHEMRLFIPFQDFVFFIVLYRFELEPHLVCRQHEPV